MRSSGGTNFGLARSVVALTKSRIACFAGPSFHDPNALSWVVCASAIPVSGIADKAADRDCRGAARGTHWSWNDGPAKRAILDFVKATTDPASPKVVAEERIATFDQNRRALGRHPIYSQVIYLDRVQMVEKDRNYENIKPYNSSTRATARPLPGCRCMTSNVAATLAVSVMTTPRQRNG